MSPLAAAATHFAEVYNARADLVAEQRGWSRTIILCASDNGDRVTVRVEGGRIAAVSQDQTAGAVVITSESATLRDILEFRRGASEPYLFGELTVRGPEADFLRLDYITEMLCPG